MCNYYQHHAPAAWRGLGVGVGLAHAGNLHRQFWRWRGLRVRRIWDFGGLRASPHLDRVFRALGIQNI